MNKKIVAVFVFLLTAVMAFASILFIDAYLSETDDMHLLAISIIFTLMTIGIIVVIIFDLLIGRKELIFEKDKIIVSRKGNICFSISKSDISNSVMTYDAYNKELCILSFKCGKKKYYLSVNRSNKKIVEGFFADIKYTKRDNTLGYVVQHVLEVFS